MEVSNLLLRIESRYLKLMVMESFASSLCSNPSMALLELVSRAASLVELALPPGLAEELLAAPLLPPTTPPSLFGICAKAVCSSSKKNKVTTVLNIDYN